MTELEAWERLLHMVMAGGLAAGLVLLAAVVVVMLLEDGRRG